MTCKHKWNLVKYLEHGYDLSGKDPEVVLYCEKCGESKTSKVKGGKK